MVDLVVEVADDVEVAEEGGVDQGDEAVVAGRVGVGEGVGCCCYH